jgi:hypothetical protein
MAELPAMSNQSVSAGWNWRPEVIRRKLRWRKTFIFRKNNENQSKWRKWGSIKVKRSENQLKWGEWESTQVKEMKIN